MKNKYNAGFSLIEVLVAIVILAAIVIPTCSSLVLSHRMNAKTEELMQAQLEVSSAVETLMAEGIAKSEIVSTTIDEVSYNMVQDERFPNVSIEVGEEKIGSYAVTFVSLRDNEVQVETFIRTNEEVQNGAE